MDNTARSVQLAVEENVSIPAKTVTEKRKPAPRPARLKKKKSLHHVIYPSFRSQFISLVLFGLLLLVALAGERLLPGLVIKQALLSYDDSNLMLLIPPLVIPPALVVIKVLFAIFNYRYIIDKHGLEAQEGLLWLNLRQPRLRFEDIKGIEVSQTLLQRVLAVGDIRIGSAAVGREEGEVRFRGISNPRRIQRRIQRAIDNRKGRLLRKNARISLEQALEKI